MNWYLIYTHFNHEKKVQKYLEKKNFETFLPSLKRCRQQKDQEITIPLYSSYLFVRAEMNVETYLEIVRIPGVVGFFRKGGEPAIIPDEEVESIRRSLWLKNSEAYHKVPFKLNAER